MMNEPAFPTGDIIRRDDNGNLYGAPVSAIGLTKRELIAAMAMQGMLSNPQTALQSTDILKNLSLSSTKVADALLEALK